MFYLLIFLYYPGLNETWYLRYQPEVGDVWVSEELIDLEITQEQARLFNARYKIINKFQIETLEILENGNIVEKLTLLHTDVIGGRELITRFALPSIKGVPLIVTRDKNHKVLNIETQQELNPMQEANLQSLRNLLREVNIYELLPTEAIPLGHKWTTQTNGRIESGINTYDNITTMSHTLEKLDKLDDQPVLVIQSQGQTQVEFDNFDGVLKGNHSNTSYYDLHSKHLLKTEANVRHSGELITEKGSFFTDMKISISTTFKRLESVQ